MSDLTPREKDVYKLLITNSSIDDIAKKLCLTSSTVRTHRTSIYQKLLVNSRTELMADVIQRLQKEISTINQTEDFLKEISDLNEVELGLYKYQLIGQLKEIQHKTRVIDKIIKKGKKCHIVQENSL